MTRDRFNRPIHKWRDDEDNEIFVSDQLPIGVYDDEEDETYLKVRRAAHLRVRTAVLTLLFVIGVFAVTYAITMLLR